MPEGVIIEWYALKCFSLGSFITGFAVYNYFKRKYEVKHFEIERVTKLKKP